VIRYTSVRSYQALLRGQRLALSTRTPKYVPYHAAWLGDGILPSVFMGALTPGVRFRAVGRHLGYPLIEIPEGTRQRITTCMDSIRVKNRKEKHAELV
jgi:hypothetical protein